ncbi:MAG: L,D-transpeptidase family protein [Pseudomonadota bacterium]
MGTGSAYADDEALLGVMHEVLSGRMAVARNDLQALPATSRTARLSIELSDMARGGYATEGNRAFTELAPLWAQARSRFVAARPVADNQLPDVVLALPDRVEQLMVADTSRSIAWLLASEGDQVRVVDAFYFSVGTLGVDKQRRGDRRTPLGAFFVSGALDTSRLPSRYGSHALPLDYPNALDRYFGRTGDGIWLHGMDPTNNVRPPRDTDGCLAFANDRVAVLAGALSAWQAPVLVLDQVRWRPVQMRSPLVSVFTKAVADWNDTWIHGVAESHLRHYASDFSRDGMTHQEWRTFRETALQAGTIEDGGVAQMTVLLVDAKHGIYLTRFAHRLVAVSGETVEKMHRLYWQHIDGAWRIVAEQSG